MGLGRGMLRMWRFMVRPQLTAPREGWPYHGSSRHSAVDCAPPPRQPQEADDWKETVERLRGTTEKDMWRTDLDAFEIVRVGSDWQAIRWAAQAYYILPSWARRAACLFPCCLPYPSLTPATAPLHGARPWTSMRRSRSAASRSWRGSRPRRPSTRRRCRRRRRPRARRRRWVGWVVDQRRGGGL